MIRALGYFIHFLFMTLLGVILGYALLLFIIGILMFVTWSVPAVLPFTWGVFRLIIALGMFFGVLFIFSNDARSSVDAFVKSFDKGYKS